MTEEDPPEPIIEALLEEVLGSADPPDLKQRILAAHQAECQDSQRRADGGGLLPPVLAPQRGCETRTEQTPIPTVVVKPTSSRLTRRSSAWKTGWLAAACGIVATVLFALWMLEPEFGGVALSPNPKQDVPVRPNETGPTVDDSRDSIAHADADDYAPASPEQGHSEGEPLLAPEESSTMIADAESESPSARRKRSSDEQVVEYINHRLAAVQNSEGITPAGQVSDEEWRRRAYRFLLGVDPEDSRYGQAPTPKDRGRFFDSLVRKSEFVDRWAGIFTDVLVGSALDQKGFDRAQLAAYLRKSLQEHKSFDQITTELLTAEGSNQIDRDDHNPATNFLLAHQGDKKTRATDKVCQVFLGKQMQCAQCHAHPLNAWTQEQYWGMTSFFAQTVAERNAGLVDRDYVGESGTPRDAELFFVRSDDSLATAYPEFLDGTHGNRSGLIEDVNRRGELAAMIVQSKDFSQAFINRLWDRAFGSGFANPVDDMGPHNPPSHPALLERLAEEFQNGGFQVRDVMRWIVLCSAFDRQARPKGSSADGSRYFASFQSPPEAPDLATSLRRLADARSKGGAFGDRVRTLWQATQGNRSISSEEATRVSDRTSAKLTERLLDTEDEDGLIRRIARSDKMQRSQKIEHLFLATVGRKPRLQEFEDANKLLGATVTVIGLQDLGWVLLNSEEFVTQH